MEPTNPESGGVVAENPTDTSKEESNKASTEKEGTQAPRDEEMIKMRKELEELRASLQKLTSLSEGRVGESSMSIERDYELMAHYNLPEEGTQEPFRKVSLREPPTFDGTEVRTDPYALREWLKDVFEFVTLNFPNDEQAQVRYAMRLLKKGARTGMARWSDRLRVEGRPLTMTEWAMNLKRILQPRDPAVKAQVAWTGARMRDNEDACQYYERLQSYVECMNAAGRDALVAPISDEALAAQYRNTLRRQLRQRMVTQTRIMLRAGASLPDSSWEWMHLAVELEEEIHDEEEGTKSQRARKDWKKGRGTNLPKATVEQADRIPIDAVHQAIPKKVVKQKKKLETRTCYRCQEPGHIAVNCPKNETAPGPQKTDHKE